MDSTVPAPARRCFKVTRRFSPRTLFRKPKPHVVEIVEYGIAVAANAAGVRMHEFGIEANRVRLVLSATDLELEAFMESLDEVISEGSDNSTKFWRRGAPYRVVPLNDDAAVVDATVDVLTSASRYGRSSAR